MSHLPLNLTNEYSESFGSTLGAVTIHARNDAQSRLFEMVDEVLERPEPIRPLDDKRHPKIILTWSRLGNDHANSSRLTATQPCSALHALSSINRWKVADPSSAKQRPRVPTLRIASPNVVRTSISYNAATQAFNRPASESI